MGSDGKVVQARANSGLDREGKGTDEEEQTRSEKKILEGRRTRFAAGWIVGVREETE